MPQYRINSEVVRVLRKVLSRAKLESCAVDPKAQEAMRLYMETWIAQPIESCLDVIEGRRTGHSLRHTS